MELFVPTKERDRKKCIHSWTYVHSNLTENNNFSNPLPVKSNFIQFHHIDENYGPYTRKMKPSSF